jgi:hypothetical protein
MADVVVASQLSQWHFDKPDLVTRRPERSSTDSTASSPNLCDDVPETLRIDTATSQESTPPSRKESAVFQERYLSSEEDLTADDGSGSESEYDYDDVVVHDLTKESKARTMSISRWNKGKSCDMAILVSYAQAGRPKVVELDCRSPVGDRPALQQRSASVANILNTTTNKLKKVDQAQRLSMKVMPTSRLASPPLSRSTSPADDVEPRRPSTSHSPVTLKPTTYMDSASITSSFQTASSRNFSPAPSEAPRRPSTSTARESSSNRSSVYVPTRSRLDLTRIQTSQSSYRSSSYTQSQFTPLTPSSPALSFLSSDPYENSNSSAASPIIKKPAAHRRLRSISMKLSLAKIAISPAKKTYDTRINGRAPSTPMTPITPMTAPIEGSASFASPKKLRRASTLMRPKSRGGDSIRAATPEIAPPVPQLSTMQQKRSTTMGRMVARGANEIEPTLVLPPCPGGEADDPMASIRSRALRRRKSLMEFMDSL